MTVVRCCELSAAPVLGNGWILLAERFGAVVKHLGLKKELRLIFLIRVEFENDFYSRNLN